MYIIQGQIGISGKADINKGRPKAGLYPYYSTFIEVASCLRMRESLDIKGLETSILQKSNPAFLRRLHVDYNPAISVQP